MGVCFEERETGKKQTGNKRGGGEGGSLSLVLFYFPMFCTHSTFSLCYLPLFADHMKIFREGYS